MRLKLKKKVKKTIINIFNILIILLFIWVFWVIASVIDTNIYNNPTSPNYQDFSNWNIFTLLE